MVRGEMAMNALTSISRNMAIVRHGEELTLVDPIRLSPSEEGRLDSLGIVKRVLRLGSMHGADDAYYLDRYGAELWAPGLSESYPEPAPSVIFDESTVLPFPDAKLFRFEGTVGSEGALLLSRGKGMLITCDAVQHYGDFTHNNWLARLLLPFLGFSRTTLIGPIWLKAMTPKGGSLESEFGRLLSLEFDALLSVHGTLLATGAHGAVEAAVARAYSS